MRSLELILLALFLAGCSTTARWDAGVTRETDRVLPAVPKESVAVFYKDGFSLFETESEKLPVACYSTTLLRKMGTLEGPTEPPPGDFLELAELTTEEFPRDEERSKISGHEYARVLGIGGDEYHLFQVAPSALAVELGVARLKELAAGLGADEVRDVFYTGYAEHQMWEGSVFSLAPSSPDSPLYTNVSLLEFRLRDVRFHGTAVRRRVVR